MKIIILLGGNIGDSRLLFNKSIQLFKDYGYLLVQKSSLYSSEAWGYSSENVFLNQVLILENKKNVENILLDCLSIEKELGRERRDSAEYADRPIDIDILYIDRLIIERENLIVPHPRMHLRRFTLAPLAEILPDFIHPILKKDHKSLLLLCTDSSKVEVITE
jgi:2-amino-4-hydroxy-6-hydroxymethyldihydropteridine diphosphokinase